MAGRSLILQKKLSELESEVADIIRLPLDPATSGSISFHDIKQRFVFFNNLLHREIASGQPQNSDELNEIGRRFNAIQADFSRWNEWRHSVCSDCTQVLLRGDEREFSREMSPEDLSEDSPMEEMVGSKRDACAQVVPYDYDESVDFSGDETPEKLSNNGLEKEEAAAGLKRDACTQVVLYDDDESVDFSGDEMLEKLSNNGAEKEEAAAAEVVTEEKLWGKMEKYSGAFVCGMIVGAVSMARLFFISFSHDNCTQYEALLLPPT